MRSSTVRTLGTGADETCGGTSRRCFLQGTAGAAGALVLAACAPSDDEPPQAGSAGDAPAADGALVAVADVPVGGAVSATGPDGAPLIVAQPQEGTVVAFSAVCTHEGCTVGVDGEELVCPCHGSLFDIATGENLDGPAPQPLPEVAVEVRDGQVVLA